MVAFGFLSQLFGGGGDLRIMVLLKNECSLSGGHNHGGCGGDTQHIYMPKWTN